MFVKVGTCPDAAPLQRRTTRTLAPKSSVVVSESSALGPRIVSQITTFASSMRDQTATKPLRQFSLYHVTVAPRNGPFDRPLESGMGQVVVERILRAMRAYLDECSLQESQHGGRELHDAILACAESLVDYDSRAVTRPEQQFGLDALRHAMRHIDGQMRRHLQWDQVPKELGMAEDAVAAWKARPALTPSASRLRSLSTLSRGLLPATVLWKSNGSKALGGH